MPKNKKKPEIHVESTEVSLLLQQNIVHALAYFPYFIGAISMHLLGRTNKEAAMHHIMYSGILAAAAILGHVFLSGSILGWMIFPVYMIGSGFLAWKAYNGEVIQIELLDSVEEKITKSVKK